MKIWKTKMQREKHHSKGWICIKQCKSQYEKLIFQKSKRNKNTKNYEKLVKQSMKKQGLKTEGFQDQIFIDFGLILDGFWGKNGSRTPSRKGPFF